MEARDPLDHDPIVVKVKWERRDNVISRVEVDRGEIRAWWKECHDQGDPGDHSDWATREITGLDVEAFWRAGADPDEWSWEASDHVIDESPDSQYLVSVEMPEELA